jgi:hypothetical protein
VQPGISPRFVFRVYAFSARLLRLACPCASSDSASFPLTAWMVISQSDS